MPCVVIAKVLARFDKMQVFWLVVAAVMVGMMNMPAFWYLSAIGFLPNNSVQADAIALEIQAAKVVTEPFKLLDSVGYNIDLHGDLPWMLCDTAL